MAMAAVISLTRSMAIALAPHGITVNALAPGIIHTDMWDKVDGQRGSQRGLAKGEALAERVAAIPIGRVGHATDVAAVAELRESGRDFLLLDVREDDEYAIAKIDGLRHKSL